MGVADPGNRESQLRTDSADAEAVNHTIAVQKGVRARRSQPCPCAIRAIRS